MIRGISNHVVAAGPHYSKRDSKQKAAATDLRLNTTAEEDLHPSPLKPYCLSGNIPLHVMLYMTAKGASDIRGDKQRDWADIKLVCKETKHRC
jgi:hypothetical protein